MSGCYTVSKGLGKTPGYTSSQGTVSRVQGWAKTNEEGHPHHSMMTFLYGIILCNQSQTQLHKADSEVSRAQDSLHLHPTTTAHAQHAKIGTEGKQQQQPSM
jgi:hypothetical protein